MSKLSSKARFALTCIILSTGCAAEVGDTPDIDTRDLGEEPEVGVTMEGLRVEGCPDWQLRNIANAMGAAKKMLERKPTDANYKKWFGFDRNHPNYDNYVAQIKDLRQKMWDQVAALGAAARPIPEFRVTCGCAFGGTNAAETIRGSTTTFRICDQFASRPLTGRDSQGGILIHEMAHLFGAEDLNWTKNTPDRSDDIDDFTFALQLPIVFGPEWAYFNANNHEYFNENQ